MSEDTPDGKSDRLDSLEEREALDALMTQAHGELREIAKAYLLREPRGHTLQPTDLVHEAYLRLLRDRNLPQALEKKHFFFAATRAKREILVEHARRKREGGQSDAWPGSLPRLMLGPQSGPV